MELGPNAAAILAGVTANAITSMIHTIVGYIRADVSEADLAKAILDSPAALLLQRAIVSAPRDPAIDQRVQFFLASPEVECIVRQLFASHLTKQGPPAFSSIRQEFRLSFRLHVDSASSDKVIDDLFESVLGACDQGLAAAVDQRSLSAHDIRQTSQMNLLRDEIKSIGHSIEVLARTEECDLTQILSFERKYREAVGSRHGTITPPNFDTARKLPIDDLYVPANLAVMSSRNIKLLTLDQFLRRAYRTVVLGNPGAGKSTLANKICSEVANQGRRIAGRQATPVLVVTRDYGLES